MDTVSKRRLLACVFAAILSGATGWGWKALTEASAGAQTRAGILIPSLVPLGDG